MKKTLKIMGIITAFCLTFTTLSEAESFFYDFKEKGILKNEDFVVNKSDGKITKTQYIGKDCFEIKGRNDGYFQTVTKNFDKLSEDNLSVCFDILYKSTNNENGFFSIGTADSDILTLGVKQGNLVYASDNGEYCIVKRNIAINKWYSVKIEVDTVKGIWMLEFDGVDAGEFLLCDTKYDNICFYTKYSKGFCVANLDIEKTKPTKSFLIDGASAITYIEGSPQMYEFVAGEAVSWSVTPQNILGMTCDTTPDGNLRICTGADMEYNGIIKIIAENNDGAAVEKNILLTRGTPEKIEIAGSGRVCYDKGNFEYTAKVYDQFGNLLNVRDTSWNITNACDGVTFSNGVISVSSELKNGEFFEISAACDGLSATKRIATLTKATYEADDVRFDKLTSAISNVLEMGRDIYGNTPLMASGYDTVTGKPVEFLTKGGVRFVPANLGMDSGFYRVLDKMSEITDDDTYKNRVDSIYKWYMENGLDSRTKLGYWGGHTCIDLKTSGIHMSENTYTHELKNTALYVAPFYRINKKKASQIVRNIWGGHVGSEKGWENLTLNRHAYFDSARFLSVLSAAEAMDNLDLFELNGSTWQRSSQELPFRAAGDDLVKLGLDEYIENNNEAALIWSMRLLNMYYNCRNEETGIVPHMYSTARKAVGGQDILGTYGSEWWKMTATDDSEFTHPVYGDRFFNQFAEDLVEQGFYDESALNEDDTRLLEGNYFSSESNMVEPIINDLCVAKILGFDTEYGRRIRDITVKSITGYIKYAWEKDTNYFHPIMADGTRLTGFKAKKNGYFGNYYNSPKIFGTFAVDALNTDRDFFEAVTFAYEAAIEDNSLSEEAEILRYYIDYKFKKEGIINRYGVISTSACTERRPEMINALIHLYNATGDYLYLDVARKTADTMFYIYCKKGVFSYKVDGSEKYRNIELGGRNAKFYGALLNLESTISGDNSVILWPFDSYFHDYFEDEKTGVATRTTDSVVYSILK